MHKNITSTTILLRVTLPQYVRNQALYGTESTDSFHTHFLILKILTRQVEHCECSRKLLHVWYRQTMSSALQPQTLFLSTWTTCEQKWRLHDRQGATRVHDGRHPLHQPAELLHLRKRTHTVDTAHKPQEQSSTYCAGFPHRTRELGQVQQQRITQISTFIVKLYRRILQTWRTVQCLQLVKRPFWKL